MAISTETKKIVLFFDFYFHSTLSFVSLSFACSKPLFSRALSFFRHHLRCVGFAQRCFFVCLFIYLLLFSTYICFFLPLTWTKAKPLFYIYVSQSTCRTYRNKTNKANKKNTDFQNPQYIQSTVDIDCTFHSPKKEINKKKRKEKER